MVIWVILLAKITIEVDDYLLEDLKKISEIEGMSEDALLRAILEESIRNWKLKYAVRLYREGKVSLWMAARIAGLSLWEMIDKIGELGVELRLDPRDLEEE